MTRPSLDDVGRSGGLVSSLVAVGLGDVAAGRRTWVSAQEWAAVTELRRLATSIDAPVVTPVTVQAAYIQVDACELVVELYDTATSGQRPLRRLWSIDE